MMQKVLFWCLPTCFVAQTAHAAAAGLVVSIDYRAPAGCPSRGEFLDEVLRRLPKVRISTEADGERQFDVDVVVTEVESTARLEFVDADASPVQREIVAGDCDEAVSGIALVTALAIDPRLSVTGSPLEETAPSEPPLAPSPSGEPAQAEPAPARVASAQSPPTARPKFEADRGRDFAPRGPERQLSWALGAAVGVVSDVAPRLTPTGLGFVELGPNERLRARLSFGYADSGSVGLEDGRARFRLIYGRSELCPVVATLKSLTLRPCAAVELGALAAMGEDSQRQAPPKSGSTLWFAGVGSLRSELALGGAFSLELAGQVRVPFLRWTYVFEQPEDEVYETPRVGGGVLVGARARLQ